MTNLWFLFALMTAAASFAVLLPLGLRSAQDGGSEVVVYKDQLAEIDRDLAAGLIGAGEAEAARNEVRRRLLSAADQAKAPPLQSNTRLRRLSAVLALVGLPALALGIYAQLGSPQLPDFPLAARESAREAQPLDRLVALVEQRLKENPSDGRGWAVLAPVLLRLGRHEDAVRAFRASITYNGESAHRRADLGEAIATAAGGIVTAEAKTELDRALALDAGEMKARYFLGLAAEQDGRKAEAASIWRAMLDKAPPEAPWRPMVQESLARVGGDLAPAISDKTVSDKTISGKTISGKTISEKTISEKTMAGAQNMSEADRDTMIRGMVERLASRLRQNGQDVDGWLRLVRAYVVMGDREKAKGALADARQAVAKDAERLRQLNEGLKGLGLDG